MASTNRYDPRAYSKKDPFKKYNSHSKPNVFISALLGFFAFAFLCIFIVLLSLRAGNIASAIKHVDIAGMLYDTEMAYYIENQLSSLHFHDREINIYDVEHFLKSEAVTNEISGVLEGYAGAFIAGNLSHHLSTDDILDIVRNLEPELVSLFDHRMTEEDYENFAMTLNDIVGFSSLSVGDLVDVVDVDLTVPFLLISPQLLWGIGVICGGLLFFIFFQRRRNIASALFATGIPIALSGLVTFIGGSIAGSPPESFGPTILSAARFLEDPAHQIMQHGFAFIALGLLLAIVSFVFKSVAPKAQP